MDQQLDRGFDDIAVTEFRSATASELDLFTASGGGLELLQGIKNRAFAFGDLIDKPIIVLADSLLRSFDAIEGGSICFVGPLVTERCSPTNIEVGTVLWTSIGVAIDHDDVFEFLRR